MNLEQTLIEATRTAGIHIRQNAFKINSVEWKQKDDPVTDLDRSAEKLFRETMARTGTYNYIGEEYAPEDNGADITLIIDPIDGTKSFLRREFYTSLSVGVHAGGDPHEGGQLIGGIVYDFMRDLMYVGFEGKTYVLYGEEKQSFDQGPSPFSKTRVSVTGNRELEKCLEDEGFSLCEKHGSIALNMAELASGTHDINISAEIGKGNMWDVAGGLYLMQASGCEVYDYKGKPFTITNGGNGMIAFRKGIKDKFPHEIKDVHEIGRDPTYIQSKDEGSQGRYDNPDSWKVSRGYVDANGWEYS